MLLYKMLTSNVTSSISFFFTVCGKIFGEVNVVANVALDLIGEEL